MIIRIDPQAAAVPNQEKARLILEQSRSDAHARLWRAALGEGTQPDEEQPPSGRTVQAPPTDIDQLIAAISGRQPASAADASATAGGEKPSRVAPALGTGIAPGALGANEGMRGALSRASQRTGVPPAALAAIVDAEAAKGRGGAWKAYSRNSRSSAAGIGQFLSGTWTGLAQQKGTWLNTRARINGWLDGAGRVRPDARPALLALRYDPAASIEAIADYSRNNLDRLKRNGVDIGDDVRAVAEAAYLGHHLGPGDAVRFLRGTMPDQRAQTLLSAQIGAGAAARRIADSGDASAAHRQWLTSYISRQVRPERYASV